MPDTNPPQLTYEAFKEAWLEDVIANNPTTVQLGHRFSRKILGDWLDFNSETEDIVSVTERATVGSTLHS